MDYFFIGEKTKLVKFYRKIKIVFKKDNDLTSQDGRANERAKRIILTSIAAAFAQVLAMAIPLITVRVSLNYMGTEIYGLWMAVTSFFALMTFADLGLGNGLQTELCRLVGKDDMKNGKTLISNAYIMTSFVAIVIVAFFLGIFPFVNWGGLINTANEITANLSGAVVLAIFIPKMLGIPISLIRRSQAALQEGFISYIWQGIASIFSLLSIYIVVYFNMGVITLILVSSIIPLIVALFNTFQYFLIKHPELGPSIKGFDKKQSIFLFRVGIAFFLLAILNTLGMNMDSFIVARTSNLENVTTFSIALRVTQLISVATTMLSSPLWAANGEALARGDFLWVAKITRKMSMLSVALTVISSVFILLFGKYLFGIWLGYDINISITLLAGLLLMQILFSYISPYFMVLNGAGIVRKQIYVFLIYSPLSFAFKYLFGYWFGMEFIPYVGAVCYGFLIIIPVYIMARKVFLHAN